MISTLCHLENTVSLIGKFRKRFYLQKTKTFFEFKPEHEEIPKNVNEQFLNSSGLFKKH